MKHSVLLKLCDGIHLLTAILVTSLGAFVLYGWYTRTISLIQILPTFVPMQYNTALGFLFLGSGVFALFFNKKLWVIVLGSTVSILGFLTLIQYILGVDLNIDELFMKHDITVRTSHPGRMAPNTALCFLLSGIAMSLCAFRHHSKWIVKAFHSLGILVLVLASVATIGYLFQLEAAYGWGHLTRMALHTSVGFLLSGVGFFAIAFRWTRTDDLREGRWLPVLAGGSVLFLCFLLWQAFKANEMKDYYTLNEDGAKAVRNEIETEFDLRMLALERMVRRVQTSKTLLKESWEKDANLYIEHYPSLQRLSIITESNKNGWSVANQNNPGFDSYWQKVLQRVSDRLIEKRLKDKEVWVESPTFGQTEIIMIFPFVALEEQGVIIAGVDLKVFFDFILENLNQTYSIHVYKEKEVIYEGHPGMASVFEKKKPGISTVTMRQAEVEVRVLLTPNHRFARKVLLPNIFLFFGVLVSVSFGFVVYLAQKNQAAYKLLKEQSDQIIQSEKMSALGTMAAGVAHELNNPMMGILNYVQYSIKKTTPDNRIYPVLQDAEKEIRRCTRIVSDILTFSRSKRDGKSQHSKVQCSEVMESALSTVSKRIESQSVKIQKKYDAKVDQIEVDSDKIEQVILNLVINALDAMDSSPQKQLDLEISSVRNTVCISVSDYGPGIPKDLERRIFDPFFTTKDPGKGTGLGLSICRSIVQEHGGELQFENKEGGGTIFRILLPLKGK